MQKKNKKKKEAQRMIEVKGAKNIAWKFTIKEKSQSKKRINENERILKFFEPCSLGIKNRPVFLRTRNSNQKFAH